MSFFVSRMNNCNSLDIILKMSIRQPIIHFQYKLQTFSMYRFFESFYKHFYQKIEAVMHAWSRVEWHSDASKTSRAGSPTMNAVQILFLSIDRGHAGFSPLNPRHRAHWCVKKKTILNVIVVSVFILSSCQFSIFRAGMVCTHCVLIMPCPLN